MHTNKHKLAPPTNTNIILVSLKKFLKNVSQMLNKPDREPCNT